MSLLWTCKTTYRLKSVRCDSSKNMVTFLKKRNQKVSVCTTAINAGGLTTTYHLPQQDHLLNPALKAKSIPLDLIHISYYCHFIQWSSPLQVQTTDNFAIISGYILWFRRIITTSHQPRKSHVSSRLHKYSLTFTPNISTTDLSSESQWWSSNGEKKLNHSCRIPSILRHYIPCLSNSLTTDKF
jgi:hypothetical protein